MVQWILDRVLGKDYVIPPSMKWKSISFDEYRAVYSSSVANVVGFWEREAEKLVWSSKWVDSIVGNGSRSLWFYGGSLDAYFNIVERHKDSWIWSKPAFIWEGEDENISIATYSDLHSIVERCVCSLKSLGVGRGDWVIFYTPPMIESFALMLALVKIGAPFEAVFTGFSYGELAKRIINRNSKFVVVADGFLRRGRTINTREALEKALNIANIKPRVIAIERLGLRIKPDDILYSSLLKTSTKCVRDIPPRESNEPLFGLHVAYEDDFKPLTHSVGGYLVQTYATSRWIGLRPHDTYFCTVWPGWITGITYTLFGPLMIGATVILYEGGPDWPSWSRWLGMLERYAATLFLTTGGALRMLSKNLGIEELKKHNIDTLRAVLVTAEPLEVDTWNWVYRYIGTGKTPIIDSIPEVLTGRIPVVNMYIQSELATFITGNLINYTFTPLLPGSVGTPIPGFNIDVVDDYGNPVVNSIGRVVVKEPWPAIPIEAPEEFYNRWYRGLYDTGDYGLMNENRYIYIFGRRDCVIKSSGYRISPGCIEKIVEKIKGVKRAVVVGYPDDIRFEKIFVLIEGTIENVNVIKNMVREWVGPIAEPSVIAISKETYCKSKDEFRKKLKETIQKIKIYHDVEAFLEKAILLEME
jgi:acetyl-CoA synthetase